MTPITRALLGAALIAGAAAPASAQTFSFGTLCGTANGSTACATVTGQLFAGYLELHVQNAQGPSLPGNVSRITGVGLYYVGGASMGSPGVLASDPGGNFSNGFSGSGGALDNPGPVDSETWLAGASVGGNGGIFGCTDPTGNGSDVSSCAGPLTFRFNFASTSAIRVADLELAFRAQSIDPNDASIKCYSSDPSSSDHSCLPSTVVPEPATLALVGTGLLGMVGVTMRRRRTTRV